MARLQLNRLDLDFATLGERVRSQFRGLNPRDPGRWPLLPKVAVWVAATILAVMVGWIALIMPLLSDLDAKRQREEALKGEFRTKLTQAINLPELRRQKIQVEEFVTQLEQQLPGKAEMDALLSDINQAGLTRGLVFELFRPGVVQMRDHYAELPVSLKVTGRYHDVGAFAAEIASLPRIVTLHDLSLSMVPRAQGEGSGAAPGGPVLSMDATARTYRYLDREEINARKKTDPKGAKK